MHIYDLILHLDKYLLIAVNHYHNYFYLILFMVIFCETGLVVTPFLPGDSLLFIAGTVAGAGHLKLDVLLIVVCLAAFLGDNCNFLAGRFGGKKLFTRPNSKIFRQDFLRATQMFYTRHGSKTVIIARFAPIVRTFAPFVAGLANMSYMRFIIFSLIGTSLWVLLFLLGGYLFGNIPVIASHISLISIVVIVLSFVPFMRLIYKSFRQRNRHD